MTADPLSRLRRFLAELKRRKVYRAAAGYLVATFVVIQLADLAAGAFGLPGWFEPLFWVLCGLGFPLALVLAWAFDLTPEGMERTTPSDSEAGQQDGATVRETSAAEPRTGERSIAVLPFVPLGQSEPGALTDGMHDALLTRLSNVGGLKVISRTSVQRYRGTEKTTSEIARELGVRWVLEGGVQEVGDRIQVNAQLIDPRTDTHAWAESYQRDLTAENLFDLQGDIIKRIAGALEAELTPEEEERVEREPTEDLDAYRLYVRGRQELARRSFDARPGETLRDAARDFRRAVEKDPDFALAWAGLADTALAHRRMVIWAESAPDPDEQRRISGLDDAFPELPEPEQAALRALELDPDLAEARASMGFVHLQDLDAPAAARELGRAVDLKPSYWEAHHWLGELYLKIGRPQAAMEHVTTAVELNPHHAQARHWLYDACLVAGQKEKSLQEARRQKEIGLEGMSAVLGEVRALRALGRLREAGEIAEERLSELGPDTVWSGWFRAYLVTILADQGDEPGARDHLDELERSDADLGMLAWAYLGLGMTDEAYAAYGALERRRWGRVDTILALRYPEAYGLGALKGDPGYGELVRTVNGYWGLEPDGGLPGEGGVSVVSWAGVAADD